MNATLPTIGATYGYARVSTEDQNEDRQFFALRKAGVDNSRIFIDHKSGKDFNRPSWKQLLQHLQHGDLLIVTSIDRLGRNYSEIINEWRNLVNVRGVYIRVLDMPLDILEEVPDVCV